jgi:general stress protein 26
MTELAAVAPAFVEVAHRIVWCTVATVDPSGRPRTRVLHPIWDWDGEALTGWIATSPRSPKRHDLDATPFASLTYWDASHDVATADCAVEWVLDPAGKEALWRRFAEGPAPVGYDPSIIPGWTSPEAEGFGGLRLAPERLRVMPGSLMLRGEGVLLTWRS